MISDKIDFEKMILKAQKGSFILYTHLSWTGRIILGEDGASYVGNMREMCPELDLGSIEVVVDAKSGTVIAARADQGEQNYSRPKPGQRLMILTANPMVFTAKMLEAIASSMTGDDKVSSLPEVQAINARHYISQLHNIGIGFSTVDEASVITHTA